MCHHIYTHIYTYTYILYLYKHVYAYKHRYIYDNHLRIASDAWSPDCSATTSRREANTHTYIHISIYIYIYLYIHVYTYKYTYIYDNHLHIASDALSPDCSATTSRREANTHTHICTHVYMYIGFTRARPSLSTAAYINRCVELCVVELYVSHIYIYVYVYTCIYNHISTHIHISICIYIYRQMITSTSRAMRCLPTAAPPPRVARRIHTHTYVNKYIYIFVHIS